MNASLILACLWALAASLIAFLPLRGGHWRAAYALIAAGIPILGWVTYQNGPWIGLLVLAGGASILRWPLRRGLGRLGRWLWSGRGRGRGRGES